MATFKQLTDQYIEDLKTLSAGNDEKLFDWFSKVASRLAARAQKIQQNHAADTAAFIQAQAASFEAHRAAQKAARAANGDSEE